MAKSPAKNKKTPIIPLGDELNRRFRYDAIKILSQIISIKTSTARRATSILAEGTIAI
ncbi:hypothetical protein MASR1M31_13660 [Porphyromonadaceae bacterium]